MTTDIQRKALRRNNAEIRHRQAVKSMEMTLLNSELTRDEAQNIRDAIESLQYNLDNWKEK